MTSDSKPGGPPKADYRRTGAGEAKRAEFPVRVAGEYRVHFSRDAYRRMKDHAATTDEVELCGVLVGRVCQDAQGFFLEIVGAIEGKGANNYGSQVTFTHETWSHINEIKDREFADQRIVGWYHTHPGFGVFLSGMDMFIQENFFSQPFQVAVVLETKRDAEGCFAWMDGKCVALRRYWVGDDEVALTAGETEEFHGDAPAKAEAARNKGKDRPDDGPTPPLAFPSVTSILFVAVFFMAGFLVDRFVVGSSMQQMVRQAVESELYSLVEGASVGALASQDFKDVRARLAALRESLPKDQPAAAKIEELDGWLAAREQEYAKRQSVLRQELQDLAVRKEGLGERVSALQRSQQDLALLVDEMYVLRLLDSVKERDAASLAKLPESEQRMIKRNLDKVIQTFPNSKSAIQKMCPGLIEFFYPQEGAEKKDGTAPPPGK